MIPIIEKTLFIARKIEKASRELPVYFTYKEHTFMTEGTKTYALCYNTETMRMVFIKCDIHLDKIVFVDKHLQIPVERLKNYVASMKEDPEIGKRYFNLKHAN